jgi:hypothetical protein
MRRFRRAPVPSCNVRQRNASGVGCAVGARRKLLIYRFLCPQIRPIPAPLEPDESGCRIASGCLIIGRGVSRSSAADLLRSSGGCSGDLEWVKRAIPCFPCHQLRFVDDGPPATATRRDRGGDRAVPEGNRARSLLILLILPIYNMR